MAGSLEQYANNYATTLADVGGIDNSQTTLTLASATGAPAAPFAIKIDSELIRVGARSGTSCSSCTRAYDGSSAASHSQGAAITHVLTAASLKNLLDYRGDDGVNFTPPDDSVFAWINQGAGGAAASVTQNPSGLYLAATDSADAIKMRVKTIPSAPYTVTARFKFHLTNINYNAAGLILIDNTDAGRNFGLEYNGGMTIVGYTTNTSHVVSAASPFSRAIEGNIPDWWQISDDNTNRIFRVSWNGVQFIQLYSEARTTTITPTKVGFYINPRNASYKCAVELLSYLET